MTRTPFGITLALVSLSACGGPVGGANDAGPVHVEATFSDIQAKILSPTCATAACHDDGGANLSGKLNLTASKAYAQLVGVAATFPDVTSKRVQAGDATKSFLVSKISLGGNYDPSVGFRMPENGAPLPAQHIQAITDWINAGAQNN